MYNKRVSDFKKCSLFALTSALAFMCACAPAKINKKVYTVLPSQSALRGDACAYASAQKPPEEDSFGLAARRVAAQKILDNMSDEEKVGQLFVTGIGGLNEETSPDVFPTALNCRQRKNIKEYNIGGVVFFGGNILNDKQIKKYIKNLQKASKTPLFISVDEEGGIVSRLGKNPNISVTTFPPMKEIGASGNPQNAYNAGSTIAKEMKALGFNLDFAPVSDVVTNPLNTIIAGKGRAFGTETNTVCAMVPEFVKGMQEQNISATLKHFPGHGDTTADTHLGRVFNDADLNRLNTVELLPFKAGIDAGVDFVMISHISLPKITGNDDPSSLSYDIVNGILRKQLGFEGIIISDDMVMEAISKHYTPQDAAVKAILAGSDMIISKLNFIPAYEGVLQAVKDGKITQQRLDESVLRILETKIKRGVIKPEPDEK